jgi:hypothetical protein
MFMRMMNEVLKPYIESFVFSYLDDIWAFSKTWEDHLQHLDQVFLALHVKLLVNMKKCTFGQTKHVYLGFCVNWNGFNIDSTHDFIHCQLGFAEELS